MVLGNAITLPQAPIFSFVSLNMLLKRTYFGNVSCVIQSHDVIFSESHRRVPLYHLQLCKTLKLLAISFFH
jgi:hypothetical protein